MEKRIIICCDGTWNNPDKTTSEVEALGKKGGKIVSCSTNVVKIANAIKSVSSFDQKRQLTYYDPGIGTSGWIVKRWFDGATGTGISQNIRKAYRFLIKNYNIDDELFFFGFSRGAYTVRSLVGLIRNSGILRSNEIDKIDRAYKLYRSRSHSTHPKEKEATLFRKSFAIADEIPIKFIGVWDTVGSLGNPLFMNNFLSFLSFSIIGNQFHDTTLSATVEKAYQALAIDEKRRLFRPTFWQKQKSSESNHRSNDSTLEQLWFKGTHSNIGGGIRANGLADIALEWMIEKAKLCKLDMEEIGTKKKSSQAVKKSWKGFYRIIPPERRKIGAVANTFEVVDISAKEEFNNNKEYHPRSLVDYYERFPEKNLTA